jgi:hypothetical protein
LSSAIRSKRDNSAIVEIGEQKRKKDEGSVRNEQEVLFKNN